MADVVVTLADADSPGATSVLAAAVDELRRRYDDDAFTVSAAGLTEPGGFFLLARVEGHLAGGVGVARRDARGLEGEVRRLWVRPDLRRGGVAVALMEALVDEARRRGLARLYLVTGGRQPEAQALYARLGWTEIDHLPGEAAAFADDHHFALSLEG
jgi:GNAT superfamily N-acetyltransferase